MDLPRGKFRSVKKGVQLGEMLDELVKTRFTGICTFSTDKTNGTLVLKSGEYVLSEIRDHLGDEAWTEIQSLADHTIDAILSDLDIPQLKLALEFNKNAFIKNPSRSSTISKKQKAGTKSYPPVMKIPDTLHQPSEKDTDSIKLTPVVPSSTVQPVSKQKQSNDELFEQRTKPQQEKETKAVESESSQTEKEYDSIDSMDFEDVSKKIRKDVKIILKQLELDHLTEK